MVIENLQRIHHIGITVRDVGRSVEFWRSFLGIEERWRQVLGAPYLGRVTGYPGVSIDVAIIDLPGGAVLEILNYLVDDKNPNPPETANPGNVHVCIEVDDIEEMWDRAIRSGATPISPGPVEVTAGPNTGVKACYVRDPDGITLELFEPVGAGR